MQKHLEREMISLKQNLLRLSTMVEETVTAATKVFQEMDEKGADLVIEKDIEIDQMEIKIEEDCLKMLALYQPVARDLRFIITVLKINGDLERIGDLAANIAKCARFLAQKPKLDTGFHFSSIIQKTKIMLKKSIDSFVNMDTQLAYEVCALDSEVDTIKNQQEIAITERIQSNAIDADSLLRFISISRHLERIADHATNIAEDVIYSVDGDIIRHHNTPTK